MILVLLGMCHSQFLELQALEQIQNYSVPEHDDVPFRNLSGAGEHQSSHLLKVSAENISH
jgi:hypothetical protein